MTKIKKIVVFTGKADSPEFPESAKIEWANPYYYVKPRDKSDAVYAPNHPKIEDEYVKAGKIAWRPAGKVVVDDVPENPEPLGTPVSEDVSEPEEQPHWSELSWPKMRSLATEFTDDPVKSKDQAKEILEQAESEGKL